MSKDLNIKKSKLPCHEDRKGIATTTTKKY